MEKIRTSVANLQNLFERDPSQESMPDGIALLMAAHARLCGEAPQILHEDDTLFIMLWYGNAEQPGLIYVLNQHDTRWRHAWVPTPWSGTEFAPVHWRSQAGIAPLDDLYSGSSGSAYIQAPPAQLCGVCTRFLITLLKNGC